MLLLKRLVYALPAPLHRGLYRLANVIRRQVWRVSRPRVEGVRVIALDGEGRVLLIRHSYGSNAWMPPGGGLHKGEDAVLAGQREMAEETGCMLREGQQIAVSDEDLHGARNRVHIVRGLGVGEPRVDGREIVAAAFFSLDQLPDPMPAGLAEALRGWAEISA